MNTQQPSDLATETANQSEPDTNARYSAPALDKGLDILEALSASADGYTLNQLSQVLQRNVNEIFRMVVTLQRRGYIQADQNDRYTLTLKMFALAHRQPPVKSLVDAALPLLQELAERTRQSAHLTIYQDGRVIVIAQVDSPERWSFGLKVGVLMGLSDTSSGHVLLAYQDEVTRTRMLGKHIKVEGELDIDPGQLFSLLMAVRKTGYAMMPSIQIQGVTNIAFPVWGLGQRVIAAINIPHIARIDGTPTPSKEQIKTALADICARLSLRLGYDAQATPASS
ncbi:transcriptional regulator, IclR family [Polaromonas sp. OV174]|uniref:IclR family transcriptional regulator n=1 Tax=Polaromonas sp. OV174 TaxID=1855300 RepID=UPI0008E8E3CF|nr:IclR family transcriptional regulator [Polaromonas sp. OV174]SFC30645.1 transcriptional regulator, IclR family [Polaromonas sp. OV174]